MLQEFCQWEMFNASCPRGEVLVMESAQYGRMELGRCLLRDYGYVGCGVSVLPYVDSKCSGRRSCTINIPDPVLDKVQPCPGDLKSYLQASYSCIRVSMGGRHLCRGGESIVLSKPKGYIASVVTEDTQLGSTVCPWLVQGQPGQQIILELYDFSLWRDGDSPSAKTPGEQSTESAGVCHIYAQVREEGASSLGATSLGAVTLCGSEERHRTVYTSESNALKIDVANMKLAKSPSYFILQYEVVGCADWPLNPVFEAERATDKMLLRCKTTGETVEYKCIDGKWQGKSLNCTEPKTWGLTEFIENAISIPQGILIVIIIGIAIFIAIVILAVGLVTLRKRKSLRKRHVLVPTDHSYTSSRSTEVSAIPKEQYPMLANPERGGNDRECDYTTTWQRRATVPATALIRDHSLPPPPREAFNSRSIGRPLSPPPPQQLFEQHSTPAFDPYHQHVDHIYESPKFEKKNYADAPFYHDLDPDRDSGRNSSPDIVPEEITYGKDVIGRTAGYWQAPPPPPPPQLHPGVHGTRGRHRPFPR